MKAWLHNCAGEIPKEIRSAYDLACFELNSAFPDIQWHIRLDPEMGDAYRVYPENGRWTVSGGETGILYGAYSMIRKKDSGQPAPFTAEYPVGKTPQYYLCRDHACSAPVDSPDQLTW